MSTVIGGATIPFKGGTTRVETAARTTSKFAFERIGLGTHANQQGGCDENTISGNGGHHFDRIWYSNEKEAQIMEGS